MSLHITHIDIKYNHITAFFFDWDSHELFMVKKEHFYEMIQTKNGVSLNTVLSYKWAYSNIGINRKRYNPQINGGLVYESQYESLPLIELKKFVGEAKEQQYIDLFYSDHDLFCLFVLEQVECDDDYWEYLV